MIPKDIENVCKALPSLGSLISENNVDIRKRLLKLMGTVCSDSTRLDSEKKVTALNICLDALTYLLDQNDNHSLKLAVHTATCIYPSVFRQCSKNDQLRSLWQKQQTVKSRAIMLLGNSNEGVKVNVIKFICGFILAQSLNTMSERDEVHIDICPIDHPFLNKSELQNEANMFLGQLITVVQSNSTTSVTVLTAVLNNLFFIAKERTQYIPVLVPLFLQYTNSLPDINLVDQRCLQKTLKNILMCLLRLNETDNFHQKLTQTLVDLGSKQYEISVANKKRMDGIFPNKKQQTRKRARIEEEPEEKIDLAEYILTTLDVSKFDLQLVVDAILTTLLMSDQRKWRDAVLRFSKSPYFAAFAMRITSSRPQQYAGMNAQPSSLVSPIQNEFSQFLSAPIKAAQQMNEPQIDYYEDTTVSPDSEMVASFAKEEKVDEKFAIETDIVVDATIVDKYLKQFKTVEFSDIDKKETLIQVFNRILKMEAFFKQGVSQDSDIQRARSSWMQILFGIIYPVNSECIVDPKSLKDEIIEYTFENFEERFDLALGMLYQEYLGDFKNTDNLGYKTFSNLLIEKVFALPLVNDKILVRFFTDLVDVKAAIPHVQQLCEDLAKCQSGFLILREYLNVPLVKRQVWEMLLNYCIDSRKIIRSMAIVTAKKWYLTDTMFSKELETYAFSSLNRLTEISEIKSESSDAMEIEGEEEKESVEAIPHQVIKFCELFLVLCSQNFAIFSHLLDLYPKLCSPVKDALKANVRSMLQSLGTTTVYLNEMEKIVQECELPTVDLVLVIINSMKDKLSDKVMQLFKSKVVDWGLEGDYIVSVIPVMSRAEIQQNLYKVVKELNDSPEVRENVITIFNQLLESKKIEASSLFVLLHTMEPEIGLKRCLEITNACLAIKNTYSAVVVANSLELMLNQSQIPTLYMRTMLQGIHIHKLDRKFINSLLFRLAQRQIWKESKLWEGFKRCCIMTAPHSFPVVITLPRGLQMEIVQMGKLEGRLQEYLMGTRG